MPTMHLTMERPASGARRRRQRSTANVFCCVEGSGETVAGDQRFADHGVDSRPCIIRQQPGVRFARHTFSRCICPIG